MTRFSLATTVMLLAATFAAAPPAEASAIVRVNGTLMDPAGTPISGVSVTVTSGSGALTSHATTTASGFSVNAYPGPASVYIEAPSLRSYMEGTPTTVAADTTLALVMARRVTYAFHFVSEAGNPVQGAAAAPDMLGLYTHPAVDGALNLCTYDGQHGNHPKAFSDSGGTARISAFELTSDAQPECMRSEPMLTDMPIDYEAVPGTHLTPSVPFADWSDGDATVVLDSVPDVALSSPDDATVGSKITLSSAVIASYPAAVRLASAFKKKKVQLWARDFRDPLHPGAWKKVGKARKVGSSGKVLFRVKFKRTTQYQVRPVKFAAGTPRVVVTAR